MISFKVHFGSGAARIRNDFSLCIRIRLKVPDPTGSGSTTLFFITVLFINDAVRTVLT
jgi:hypothetical protein